MSYVRSKAICGLGLKIVDLFEGVKKPQQSKLHFTKFALQSFSRLPQIMNQFLILNHLFALNLTCDVTFWWNSDEISLLTQSSVKKIRTYRFTTIVLYITNGHILTYYAMLKKFEITHNTHPYKQNSYGGWRRSMAIKKRI